MTRLLNKNDFFERFASCVRDVGLLKNPAAAAECVQAGGTFLISSTGLGFNGDFLPAVKGKNNLNAAEFFEGKFCSEKNQTNKNRLKERTLPAPNS